MVAGSTLIIIQIGRNIENPERLVFWILLYMISLLAIFIPRYGYQYCLTKAKHLTFQNYINRYILSYNDYLYLNKDKIFVNERKAFLQNETWTVINESYDFIIDFLATLLNVSFNVIVICHEINSRFLKAYMFSFFIVYIVMKFSSRRTIHLTSKVQKNLVTMKNIMLYSWDTIFSGNQYNCSCWLNKLKESSNDTLLNEKRKLNYTSVLAFVTMLMCSFPIVLVLLATLLKNTDVTKISILLITLPRQINTIQYINILVTYFIKWNGVRSKIQGLNQSIIISESYKFNEEFIKIDRITISKNNQEYHFFPGNIF